MSEVSGPYIRKCLGKYSQTSSMSLQRYSESSVLPTNSEYIFFVVKRWRVISTPSLPPSLPAEWKKLCVCWIRALGPTLGKCCTIFSVYETHLFKSLVQETETAPSFFFSSKNVWVRKNIGHKSHFSLVYTFSYASICLLSYDKDCQVLVAASSQKNSLCESVPKQSLFYLPLSSCSSL